MITFDALSENISGVDANGNRFGKPVDGISAWYHENDYDKFIGHNVDEDYEYGFEIEYNGHTYIDHWFFVNELHESGVIGYSMLPIDGDGDVIFYICGCKVDHVCTFNEMIEYLTSELYFVD